MKQVKTILMSGALLASSTVSAITVHTIGDSTMATYEESTTVTRGWGQMFQQFFTDDVTVNNHAKSGASSKSFYEEAAYWESVKKQIEPGDYVLIQFAHNDEKNNGMDGDELKAYYESIGDQANADATDYRGTTASGTYKEYLRKYVDETQDLGATPILVGAICRKYFTGSKIRRNGRHDLGDDFSLLTADGALEDQSVPESDNTYDYPYQMMMVAQEKDVPFIDLTTATAELYESYGDEMANELLFDGEGSTHTSAMGATLIARLAAQLLQQAGILTDYINLTSDITVTPSPLDFGNAYKGQSITKEIYISGFDLQPSDGTVSVDAEGDIQISSDGETFGQSLTLDYEGGNIVSTLNVQCEFAEEGPVDGKITVANGDYVVEVSVTGTAVSLADGEETQAYWRLESNDECTTTGPLTSLGETFSSMYVQRFSAPNSSATWPEWTGFDATRKTQRCLIEGDVWPDGEIDEVSTRYIEFAVQAASGATFNVDSMSMFVCGAGGNGMNCKIYYSKEEDFANPINIFEMKKMPANSMQYVVVTPVLEVNDSETLRIRIYPWYNGTASGKTICISDVTIHGVTVDDSGTTSILDATATENAMPIRSTFYGSDGVMRSSAKDGLNIVRKEYSDGTVKTEKIIY